MMSLARVLLAAACVAGSALRAAADAPASAKIDDLLARMTIEEKVGQLNMVSITPVHEPSYAAIERGIRDGAIGGLFNVHGAAATRELQALAVGRSRLGVPLFLALDVLHGYRTIFPTPLAQAASWDMDAIRRSERIAAIEATAGGVNMLLSPMLDVTRDARWGRVVEGVGESAWLGARIAEARLRGIEGDGPLTSPDAAVACVKHLGANGAVEGGRDYTAQDISERALRETYLPPFYAASVAGARCMMAAFNAPDGAPSVANPRLLTDILRREWGFGGLVMSDFEAIDETVAHGFAAGRREAARLALEAGADVDMQSRAFLDELPQLVRDGVVPSVALDAAVRRVLSLKSALGLFDDPFRGADPAREERVLGRDEHRAVALELAEKSIVLLKNKGDLLPFAGSVQHVALIGPLGDSAADTLGPWAARGEPHETVTLKQGLEQRLEPHTKVDFTPGGTIEASSDREVEAAVETARRADVVVLALGERFNQSGEGASRAALDLPGDQMTLARAVLAQGKPTVVVVMAGRPLVLTELAASAPAILNAWQPGSMGGLAIVRVLMGDVAPSGRLPVTFPRSVGQVPIHHDQRPTGRPAVLPPEPYTAGYVDESHLPLYPFGYGLTYTQFAYAAPQLDRPLLRAGGTAVVTVDVTNTGKRAGVANVQLYLRARVARVARPLRELRGFALLQVAPGETATARISITPKDFAYWRGATEFGATPGPVDVMTGPDAQDVKTTTLDYRP